MPKVCPVCDTVYSDSNIFCPVDGTTLHVVDLDGGLIGSVVADRYLVTDLLGEGGMGKVYLARHVRLPQQAAIKVLRAEMVKDPAAVARFNREASNASRIDDENVARVYDFGEAAGGTVYLAMEYVAGRSLRDLIMKDGPLEPRRAADLVEQIGKGLDAAHRLKIIHRDLKPDNVLVVAGPDGRERVKVVDFGIAKAFGAEEGGLTKTGFVVGTPEFMSPEQLLGRPLDARSDVYALALVAFQCLTKALPFGGDTPESSMTARLISTPRPLAEVTSKAWPESVQAVFDRALSREVSQRPESAGEFARALKAAIDEWSVSAASTTNAKGSAATAGGRTEKPTARTVALPAPTEGGSRRWPAIAAAVVVVALGAAAGYKYLLAPAPLAPADSVAAANETPVDSGAALVAPATSTPPVPSDTAATAAAAPVAAPETAQTATRPPASPPAGAATAGAKGGADSVASAKPAPPPKPVAPVESPELIAELDELSAALKRGVNDAAATRLAGSLRAIASRAVDPATRTRAYFRLIDASALSGDLTGACAALRGARGGARTPAQLSELRKYEEQLGCS